MDYLRRIVLCFLVLFSSLANAASTASFESSTNTLTLPTVKIVASVTYENVVVHLLTFGTLAIDDPSVGSEITYESATNTIRMPIVTVGATSYPRVSLTNPSFELVSLGGIVADAGTSGRYNLDLSIVASGVPVPPTRVTDVSLPSSQSEFCTPDIYNQFQQSIQGLSGTWSITSCSFSGTTGQIAALLTVTSPIALSLPYNVTYTYTPM